MLLTFYVQFSNCRSDVLDSMLTSSVGGCVCNLWPGITNDIKLGICCFSAKHATFSSKSKEWLAQSQNGVSG